MEIFSILFICGIIAALIGSKKGEAVGAFFMGLLLGPLGILICIFHKGNRRKCPYCKEMVFKDATVCPHCRKEVSLQ